LSCPLSPSLVGSQPGHTYPSQPDTSRAIQLGLAMQEAANQGAGFWGACGGEFPEPPNDEPTPTVATYYGDCSPFQSFDEAQLYYAQNPGAQPFIDEDNDGTACEAWFGVEEPGADGPDLTPAPPSNCHPSYPDVCIPPAPPDLDCPQISSTWFTVLPPDPHGFDGDHDGIGCER
jgi:hypothetical protein